VPLWRANLARFRGNIQNIAGQEVATVRDWLTSMRTSATSQPGDTPNQVEDVETNATNSTKATLRILQSEVLLCSGKKKPKTSRVKCGEQEKNGGGDIKPVLL